MGERTLLQCTKFKIHAHLFFIICSSRELTEEFLYIQCILVQADTIKYHILSRLEKKHFFFTAWGLGASKTQDVNKRWGKRACWHGLSIAIMKYPRLTMKARVTCYLSVLETEVPNNKIRNCWRPLGRWWRDKSSKQDDMVNWAAKSWCGQTQALITITTFQKLVCSDPRSSHCSLPLKCLTTCFPMALLWKPIWALGRHSTLKS